ncbi:MAG: hypothetical protein JO113_07175 [Candidatus Eremiobacteraeota bacterium]|nr:hypothetical protein [Candidatus Eremiobacteraeota bacterium]
MTIAMLPLLAACGHGGEAVGPEGWQPIPGASSAWATGAGSTAQEYRYVNRPFGGTLQDLASSVTIDVLLHHRGAKLQGSVPIAACPGAAGVATFLLPSSQTLEEGFTVADKRSVRTSYLRRTGAAADPSVTAAMQKALCITPG